MSPEWITLDDPRARDPRVAGGKAAGLAALRAAGLRTPPGLVIPPDAALPPTADLAAWVVSSLPGPLDDGLAVRSSAADEDGAGRSFAGIHVTRLGVAPDGLAEAVGACRRSATSEAAMAYRRRRGDETLPRMAVLVQPLVRARVSGVAFGADPSTGDREVVLVEAVLGLGEPLVAGRVTPHRYTLRGSGGGQWTLAGETPGSQRVGLFVNGPGVVERPVSPGAGGPLTRDELAAVADAVRRAGDVRGAPQDVEWAIDRQGVVLLQSRPITALPAGEGTLWTRANFIEVLPDLPSPLLLSLWNATEAAMVRYYEEVGIDVRRWGGLSKVHHGRLYFNASIIARMNETLGVPPAFGQLCLGHALPPGEDPYRVRWGVALRQWRVILRLAVSQLGSGRRLRELVTGVDAFRRALSAVDLARSTDAELGAWLDAGWDLLARAMPLIFSVAGGLMTHLLRVGALLRGRVDSVEGFVGRMTAPGGKTVSAAQGIEFLALARDAAEAPQCRAFFTPGRASFADWEPALAGTPFPAAFRRFLDRYGHRGIYESEVARPRFREDPSYLLTTLAAAVHRLDRPDPEAMERGRVREARVAWRELVSRLSRIERLVPWRLLAVRAALGRIKRFQVLRERVRSEGFRGMEPIRAILEELGRRWAARGWLEQAGDVYRLPADELQAALADPSSGAAVRARAARRRVDEARWRTETMPGLLRETPGGELVPVGPPQAGAEEGEGGWRGLAVSGGLARGPAAVIRTPDDFARMRPGAILVATATDPAWSPLFALARGIAVEMGGLLSHGSILAREFALPAVVNVPGLCAAVRDGEWVEVDGWRGIVRRLRPGEIPPEDAPRDPKPPAHDSAGPLIGLSRL